MQAIVHGASGFGTGSNHALEVSVPEGVARWWAGLGADQASALDWILGEMERSTGDEAAFSAMQLRVERIRETDEPEDDPPGDPVPISVVPLEEADASVVRVAPSGAVDLQRVAARGGGLLEGAIRLQALLRVVGRVVSWTGRFQASVVEAAYEHKVKFGAASRCQNGGRGLPGRTAERCARALKSMRAVCAEWIRLFSSKPSPESCWHPSLASLSDSSHATVLRAVQLLCAQPLVFAVATKAAHDDPVGCFVTANTRSTIFRCQGPPGLVGRVSECETINHQRHRSMKSNAVIGRSDQMHARYMSRFRRRSLGILAAYAWVFGAVAANAHQSPSGCNGNGVELTLQRTPSTVIHGGTVTYDVSIGDRDDNLIACDVEHVDVVFYCPGMEADADVTMTYVITTNLALPATGQLTPLSPVSDTQTCTISVDSGVTKRLGSGTIVRLAGERARPPASVGSEVFTHRAAFQNRGVRMAQQGITSTRQPHAEA